MTSLKCDACESIREKDPNLYVNGFSDDNCENLANGKGLSGKGDNCDDLHDMNDCFIGFMDKEVNTYESCDWKVFMNKFIPNLWTTLKSIICTLCGIDCRLNYMIAGHTFKIGEEETEGSYIVAGKGISFALRSSGEIHSSDISLLYIGGGLCRLGGSLRWFTEDFEDKYAVYNFDNGLNAKGDHKSKQRKGNSVWGQVGDTANGNELLYEIRIKKSQFPEIKQLYVGFGQESNGGGYHVSHSLFDGDDPDTCFAYGQHGHCDPKTGEVDPADVGVLSKGHRVPEGWWYLQMRVSYILQGVGSSGYANWTPRSFLGIRFNKDKFDC